MEDRIKELEQLISSAAQAYYTDGSSLLTDEEFDALVDELKELSPDSECLKIGWGYDTNLDSTPGQKVKHKYGVAGSLPKCRTWKELGNTLQTELVDVSLKLDGISVVMYYKDGVMYQALTRGDGSTGIDVTDKVLRIFKATNRETTFTGAVRGEILMPFINYNEYAVHHPEAKNPRNTTAGLINAKEITDDLKYLIIKVYSIVGDESNTDISSMNTMRNRLKLMFGAHNVVPYMSAVSLTETKFIEDMDKFRDWWYGIYPADGLVITCNSIPAKQNNYITYDAKAFKFPASAKDCEVVEVEWNMTKTHYAVPKIRINPVELSGTVVEYCTGHNAKYILDSNIGPGSIVRIYKSGEIIPYITKVVEATEAQMINTCPVCGESLVWNGVHLQCQNPSCGNAVLQDTLMWINNLVPTDGLGDILIEKMLGDMVEHKLIPDISIESMMSSNVHLNEQSPSAQQNIFAGMWNRLHMESFDATSALLALNVPRLGPVTAKKLAAHENLVKYIVYNPNMHLELSVADAIRDVIGDANSKSIFANINKMHRLALIYDRIVFEDQTKTIGDKVAITGKLSVKRSDFEKELAAHGFVPGEISKDTKFLITDNPDSASSKNKKADAWGITKITETEFRNKYM